MSVIAEKIYLVITCFNEESRINCASKSKLLSTLLMIPPPVIYSNIRIFFIMNIIPAIDIKKGKVVKAIQGNRTSYNPIDLVTSYSSNPITFIKTLIITFKPSTIYIADLDLIDGDGK